MPRLYREAPLASIWEGSGNVQCLDVMRAMVKNPESVEAFAHEVGEGAVLEPRLDRFASSLRDDLRSEPETLEARARPAVAAIARSDGRSVARLCGHVPKHQTAP